MFIITLNVYLASMDHKQLRFAVVNMLDQCRFRQRVKFSDMGVWSAFTRRIGSARGASAVYSFISGQMKRDAEFEKKLDNAMPTLFPLADGKVIDLSNLTVIERQKEHLFSITTKRCIGCPTFWNDERKSFNPTRWDKNEDKHIWLDEETTGEWDPKYLMQLRAFCNYVEWKGSEIWSQQPEDSKEKATEEEEKKEKKKKRNTYPNRLLKVLLVILQNCFRMLGLIMKSSL